jgi:hypothetical protein
MFDGELVWRCNEGNAPRMLYLAFDLVCLQGSSCLHRLGVPRLLLQQVEEGRDAHRLRLIGPERVGQEGEPKSHPKASRRTGEPEQCA